MEAAAVHKSICRVCSNFCSIDVHTTDGRLTGISGDADNPIYAGYRCTKGVNQWKAYEDPARLLHSVKRMEDGSFTRIPLAEAVGEIAGRLASLRDEFGPRALAMYFGTYFAQEYVAHVPVGDGFMRAIGSPMVFSAFSLDQPGKILSKALHGMWMAPDRSLQRPEVALLVGTNPAVSHQGRLGSPAQLLRDFAAWGTKLVVIDPRRTELARKAHLHLQPKAGEDVAIMAAIIRVILDEQLEDRGYVHENVDGVDALRRAVDAFTPDYAAARAGIPAHALVEAARLFGRARRAYATSGTGPGMAGRGTLFEYLLLSLNTICGQWSRAGDVVPHLATLLPSIVTEPKAQAIPPFPPVVEGERLRSRDLPFSLAGAPTAGLAEEMLADDGPRIRALLSLGGSPATAWPDQLRTVEALKALDLLVHTDIWMSPTARLADYVIACRLPLELPSTSALGDFIGQFAVGWGYRRSYGQYTAAIVEPPTGSEVIPQWELLYLLARELGLTIEVLPAGSAATIAQPVALDMQRTPTSEELLDLVHRGSRVPLDVVRSHAGGALYDDPPATVAPKDPDWEARLDVGSPDMIAELGEELVRDRTGDGDYPFQLLCRRTAHVINHARSRLSGEPAPAQPGSHASGRLAAAARRRRAARRDLLGTCVRACVRRRGPDTAAGHGVDDARVRRASGGRRSLRARSNVGRLLDTTVDYDRLRGQPRMSGVYVSIVPSDV